MPSGQRAGRRRYEFLSTSALQVHVCEAEELVPIERGHCMPSGTNVITDGTHDRLIEQRHLVDDTHHCPHGRPTALLFSKRDLDKQFRRL